MRQRIKAAWKVLRGEYKAIPRELYPFTGVYMFNSTASATTTTTTPTTTTPTPTFVWNAVPPRWNAVPPR